jgi:hypothetical protein
MIPTATSSFRSTGTAEYRSLRSKLEDKTDQDTKAWYSFSTVERVSMALFVYSYQYRACQWLLSRLLLYFLLYFCFHRFTACLDRDENLGNSAGQLTLLILRLLCPLSIAAAGLVRIAPRLVLVPSGIIDVARGEGIPVHHGVYSMKFGSRGLDLTSGPEPLDDVRIKYGTNEWRTMGLPRISQLHAGTLTMNDLTEVKFYKDSIITR